MRLDKTPLQLASEMTPLERAIHSHRAFREQYPASAGFMSNASSASMLADAYVALLDAGVVERAADIDVKLKDLVDVARASLDKNARLREILIRARDALMVVVMCIKSHDITLLINEIDKTLDQKGGA